MVRNVKRETVLHTDESRLYTETSKEYAGHRMVKQSAAEYVRYNDGEAEHSNTVENVFSVFKRGMTGVYQHCGEAHLHRDLSTDDAVENAKGALQRLLEYLDHTEKSVAVPGVETVKLWADREWLVGDPDGVDLTDLKMTRA
jgi:hypothetical protein